MRVGMYYNNNDVRVEEREKPRIGKNEILVKVHASGICGSDVMEWYRIKKAPLVLGHEIGGEIVAVGENVKKYAIGERVFVSHHVPCNACKYCREDHHTACETLHTTNFDPGGFSEYIRVPEINMACGVFVLPQELSYAEATLIEPLGCVVRGQHKAHAKPGQNVLILGAGISGLLHLMLAKTQGAQKIVVTDMNEYRLAKAKELGADEAIHASENVPEAVKKAFGGELADLVIVCAGALSAFAQALKSVERGGTILCFAAVEPGVDLALPINDFWRNDITILPSYGAAPQDILDAIELIAEGRVTASKIITHYLPLKDIAEGFNLTKEGKDSLKIVLEPQK